MWLYHGQTWRTHTYVHMAKSWTSMRVRETCLNDQFLSSHSVPEYQMFPEIPSKYICSWRSPLIMTSGRYDILWRLDNNHKYLWEYHATFIFHQTKQWKHQNWSQYISCNVLIRPFQCLLSLINIGHVYSITSFIWSMHVIQLGLPPDPLHELTMVKTTRRFSITSHTTWHLHDERTVVHIYTLYLPISMHLSRRTVHVVIRHKSLLAQSLCLIVERKLPLERALIKLNRVASHFQTSYRKFTESKPLFLTQHDKSYNN